MEERFTAIEVTGTVDENRRLVLDNPLAIPGPKRVRVIVMYTLSDEWDESEWLRAASQNPAFDWLRDPAEDIYSLDDGKPFNDPV